MSDSRKQVSKGYAETSTGEEQFRSVLSYWFQEIVDGTTVGNPGWDMEDGQAKRRTEDNTLGMTQKVSQALKHNNNREKQEVSPMVSERDWTLKWAGAGA